MTGQDVITAVRDILNEQTAAFWTDTQLLKWINNGIIDIVSKTWCLADSETITLATGTLEYALSNDLIAVVSVTYNSAKGLVLGHPSMLGHIYDPDEPVYYYFFNQKIGILPKPTSTVDSNTCEVYEIPKPTEITVAGTVTVPSYLDDTLQQYVVGKALRKDNRPTEAEKIENEYKGNLRFYRSDLLEKKMMENETHKKE